MYDFTFLSNINSFDALWRHINWLQSLLARHPLLIIAERLQHRHKNWQARTNVRSQSNGSTWLHATQNSDKRHQSVTIVSQIFTGDSSLMSVTAVFEDLAKTSKSGSRVHYPCTYVPTEYGCRKRFLIINTCRTSAFASRIARSSKTAVPGHQTQNRGYDMLSLLTCWIITNIPKWYIDEVCRIFNRSHWTVVH